MSNLLVYCTPFEIQKGKWGYKWIGFSEGKRFSVIQDPNSKKIYNGNGEYVFSDNNQRELLPKEILKLTYSTPLSNSYFLFGKGKEVSLEVVMELIEKGYDITGIAMQKYFPYINGKRNEENYLCQYLKKDTREIIVEILDDESVFWRDSINTGEEKIYD